MLSETKIELEARNPLVNRLRRWSIEIGQDLLGMWIVDVEFGRIGSKGRHLRHVYPDQPAAVACLGRALRRRATAQERIGVAYRCVSSSLDAQEAIRKVGIDVSIANTIIG